MANRASKNWKLNFSWTAAAYFLKLLKIFSQMKSEEYELALRRFQARNPALQSFHSFHVLAPLWNKKISKERWDFQATLSLPSYSLMNSLT